MNEPIEHAEKTTGQVTVGQLLKALGKGVIVSLHGRAAHGRASYSDSFVFELRFERDGAKSEIAIPGYVTNGEVCGEPFKATEAFWFLQYSDALIDALALLPKTATIAFRIAQDAGTTERLRSVGMCADHLYLDVMTKSDRETRRHDKRSILIDVYTGGHSTSRPCFPSKD